MSDTKADRADRLRRNMARWRLIAMLSRIAFALVVIWIVIAAYFLPRLEKALDDMGRELSTPMKLVINSGRWTSGRLYTNQIIPGLVWQFAGAIIVGVAVHLA